MLVMLSCSKEAQNQHNTAISELEVWQSKVTKTLKLFGHRNWIVVADAAYPKQSNAAIILLLLMPIN